MMAPPSGATMQLSSTRCATRSGMRAATRGTVAPPSECPDQDHPLEARGVDVRDDGTHAGLECDLLHGGRVLAPAREIHGQHGSLEVRQEAIPAPGTRGSPREPGRTH